MLFHTNTEKKCHINRNERGKKTHPGLCVKDGEKGERKGLHRKAGKANLEN